MFNLLLSITMLLQFTGITPRKIYPLPIVGNIAYVTNCNNSSSSGSSISCSMTGISTANTLLINVNSQAGLAPTMTSTCGTPTLILNTPWASSTVQSEIFLVQPNNNSTCTITATFGGTSTFPYILAVAFSGANATSPIAGSIGSIGTGTTLDSGALNITRVNQVLVGFAQIGDGDTTLSAGSGFTFLTLPIPNVGAEYMVETTSGIYHATFTGTASFPWVAQGVALQ